MTTARAGIALDPSIARGGRIALIGLVAVVAACRSEATARDRLLAQLPGDAVAVAVADGAALAHPRIRTVLDVVASHWPASMSCVVEAAYAGEQVALSIDAGSNITVLIATRSEPGHEPRCPALSQREPGVWIATIGAGPAPGAGRSVLVSERFERARSYLRTAPIAAVVLGEARMIAAAQPEPLEAWLAIDTPAAAGSAAAADADAIAQRLIAQIGLLKGDPATAAFADKLRLSRAGGTQVVVALDGASGVDVVAAARTVVGWVEQHARPDAARFACPAQSAEPEIACSNGTSYRVASLSRALQLIAAGRPEPVVANGAVTGLRLAAAVDALGLVAGDLVVAIDGRLVVSRAMFLHLLAQAHTEATVTVRRGATDKDLHFVER